MPTSDPYHISSMLKTIIGLNPKSIMDVGCGFGKWGFLCREFLDIRDKNYFPSEWKIRIDGIEIFSKYLTEIHKYIYNKIYVKDVRNFDIKGYDLVILGDIIEHFEKDEAIKLIDRLIKNNNNILISTPDGFYEQDEYKGNKHQIHKCGFNKSDFERWNARVIRTDIILVAYINKSMVQ